MDNKKHSMDELGASELIVLVREGNGKAFERLLDMYEPMIAAALKKYIVDSSDLEDARQEALAGFYRATLTFDVSQSHVAFGLYSKICVTNALISHVREIARRTRGTMNLEYDDYIKYYASSQQNPAERIAEQESAEQLRCLIRQNLSPYENCVWDMHTEGMPSSEIACRLNKQTRSIDNALYRIRRKLRALLESNSYQ